MSADPYQVLGVPRDASAEEIKKAYRQCAKTLHPDLHPGDAEKAEAFRVASAAFDILGDEKKRARFDRGEIDAEGHERAPFGAGGFDPRGFGSGTHPGQGEAFEDILSGLFGARTRRRTGPVKGRDLRYSVDVSFEDAVIGARRRMTMADGRSLDVEIPAGIRDGQTLRLKSQGQPSPGGGPPGDALLKMQIASSAVWAREGDDLRMSRAISLETAVLGGKIDVPTPSGPVTMKVPAGSNTGSTLRLRGKGVQRPGQPGSLYVRLEIVLDDPKDEALRDFLKSRSGKP